MTLLYPSTLGIYFINPDITKFLVQSENIEIAKQSKQNGHDVFGLEKRFNNGEGSKFGCFSKVQDVIYII